MKKSNRLFETIQIFRAARGPLRAEDLAARLEVSVRTVYRDIAALQAMRT
ncbi:HTH domain-containing protein, partial [Pararhodobacter sp.]